MGKKALCLVFAFLLSIESFAAIVSDNDGAAFVTKAEFDALKKGFADQIENYNDSIDGKIDGAIAAYLAGVNLARQQVIDSLLNKCVKTTVNGRDIMFANNYTKPNTQAPTSARNSFLCLMLGGYEGNLYGTWRQTMLGRYGSPRSIDVGRSWLNNNWQNNNLICMACKKYNDNYWGIVDKYIYGVKYSVYLVGGSHAWAWGENDIIPTGGTTGIMPLSDLRWAGGENQKCDWAEMRRDATIDTDVTSW